mgnify:CR=1 FL=1
MPVQDCEALNRLFLFLFFCFFLWNAESGVKFKYGSDSQAGNPFISASGKHESPRKYQRKCSEYLLDTQTF